MPSLATLLALPTTLVSETDSHRLLACARCLQAIKVVQAQPALLMISAAGMSRRLRRLEALGGCSPAWGEAVGRLADNPAQLAKQLLRHIGEDDEAAVLARAVAQQQPGFSELYM